MKNRFGWVTRFDDAPPPAVTAITTADVDKTVNGAIAKLKAEFKTEVASAITSTVEPLKTEFSSLSEMLKGINERLGTNTPPPGAPPAAGVPAISPELNAEVKSLKRVTEELTTRLKAETDRREAAEQSAAATRLDSGVRSELAKFTFANGAAADDAFELIRGKVKPDDQGNLIADNLPLSSFLSDYLPNQKPYLLAPTGRGGAGAGAGNAAQGGRASSFQYEAIKPGMSKADQEKAVSAIAAALQAQAQGR